VAQKVRPLAIIDKMPRLTSVISGMPQEYFVPHTSVNFIFIGYVTLQASKNQSNTSPIKMDIYDL